MVRGIVAVVLAEVLATRVSRRKSRPGVAWPKIRICSILFMVSLSGGCSSAGLGMPVWCVLRFAI